MLEYLKEVGGKAFTSMDSCVISTSPTTGQVIPTRIVRGGVMVVGVPAIVPVCEWSCIPSGSCPACKKKEHSAMVVIGVPVAIGVME